MDKSRKEFEEWIGGSGTLNTDKDGNYLYGPAYSAWNTWQACQSLNDKRIQQLLAVIAVKDKALKLMHEAFDDGDYKDGTESYAIQKCEDSLAIKPEDVELVEVTHLRFRAVLYGGNHEYGPESHEWLEECRHDEIGDDGIKAFPVYTIKTKE